REVLARFAMKAFRRPADSKMLDRLVAIAEAGYSAPDKSFEQGVGQAMVAVLAAPRFLFRMEEPSLNVAGGTPAPQYAGGTPAPQYAGGTPALQTALVDEYALASRLSYFLWSTMPDDELTMLAQRS